MQVHGANRNLIYSMDTVSDQLQNLSWIILTCFPNGYLDLGV